MPKERSPFRGKVSAPAESISFKVNAVWKLPLERWWPNNNTIWQNQCRFPGGCVTDKHQFNRCAFLWNLDRDRRHFGT
jgi:hypothetical protein